ncbi:hypothetical protein AB0758_33940 [Tolypothrix bouteillei VB521301_2]|uniref:hypothetical protein n=1 Tax=Tolypothrix bouteillei TaxID=1246981 RepID=UPI0038B5C6E1
MMYSPSPALFLEAKISGSTRNGALLSPRKRTYERVKPGFIPLGKSLGNGEADKCVFQFDSNFPHYRQVKLLSRAEQLRKYYQTYHHYSDDAGGKWNQRHDYY